MGTFIGHAVPGLMFILYAIWSAVKQTHNRIKLTKESHQGRVVLRDVPIFRHDVLLGGVVFLLCSIGGAVGVIGYGGWSFISDGTFRNLNNWQHGTMFAFFGLHFTMTILSQTKYRVDPGMDKLYQSMAFFVEALLFFFHLHDRSELDVRIHLLLVIAILGSAICTLAEVWNPGDPVLENGWVIFLLLHGLWFFQIGFVLYNPLSNVTSWNHDESKSLMMVTAMFAWLLLLSVMINSLVRWLVIFCCSHGSGHGHNNLDQKAAALSQYTRLSEVEGVEHESGLIG